MTVPVSPHLRMTGCLVGRISNFGAFPPTLKLRDRWGVTLLLLNHDDPDATRAQMEGIEAKGVFAGTWEPVPDPPATANGVAIADKVRRKISELKPRAVGLNLEGLTIQQIRDFLWGRPGAHGFRGSNGVIGSMDGWNPGIAAYWIDEPYKDGSVKPHVDLKTARVMLCVEGFDGAMGQIDHPRAIIDRITGYRNGNGALVPADAYLPEQVVGCYDAQLGIRIRAGLYFPAERFPGIFSLRRRALNRMKGLRF